MHDPTTKEYVYAKAHGIWASSFIVGKKDEIKLAKNVQDLYRLVFEQEPPLITEALLTDLIEEKLTVRTITHYTKLLSLYDTSYPLLNLVLYEYEVLNLKMAMSHLREKESDASFVIDIYSYSPLKWKMWPSLKEITKDSIFSFLNDIVLSDKQVEKEMELDDCYCKAIWKTLCSLKQDDYDSCSKLVIKEMLLKNILWLFRLRKYYDYHGEKLKKMLLGNWDEKSRKLLIEPLSYAIDKSITDRDEWNGWKYEWLINPMQEDEVWTLDPRYMQAVSDRYLYNLALHSFHNNNNPVSILFSFFKLKRAEEYFIRQMLEKLKVGKNMPFEAVMDDG